jgi:DNA-binding transcriptional ArsR family regulator
MVEYLAETLDATYAALSHEVRRALLIRLRDGRARVTELADPFDLSLAAVSKHLRVLEDAGLVRRTITGRDHWMELAPQPLRHAAGWIETYREFWEGRLDALESMLGSKPRR